MSTYTINQTVLETGNREPVENCDYTDLDIAIRDAEDLVENIGWSNLTIIDDSGAVVWSSEN